MPKRFIKYSRTQPERTILWTIAWFTFLAGLFVFLPWYTPTYVSVSVVSGVAPAIGGLLNLVLCLPAMFGVQRDTPESLSRGAFWLFCWYIFITLIRMLASGLSSLLWVSPFIIAGVLAVIYIEQSWQSRKDRGENG